MPKTAVARISGGNYRIDDSEGRAIAAFVPPLPLKNLEWESFSPSKQWLFRKFDTHWEIIAHWLVYYRTGAVDIREKPFICPEFLDKRPIAELYNSQLDLCIAVWEAFDTRKLYPTPYYWWCDCMIEIQEAQKESILSGGGLEIVTDTKGEIEDKLRKLHRSLNTEAILFKPTPKNEHICRLYKHSIEHKSSEKVRRCWNNYLNQLKLCARAIKSNSSIKTTVDLKNGLFYREGNTLVPILTQKTRVV